MKEKLRSLWRALFGDSVRAFGVVSLVFLASMAIAPATSGVAMDVPSSSAYWFCLPANHPVLTTQSVASVPAQLGVPSGPRASPPGAISPQRLDPRRQLILIPAGIPTAPDRPPPCTQRRHQPAPGRLDTRWRRTKRVRAWSSERIALNPSAVMSPLATPSHSPSSTSAGRRPVSA